MSSMSRAEMETSITYTDADDTVRIWTCIASDLRRLRNDSRFAEVAAGVYRDGHEWARFEIPRAQWNPIRGAKRQSTMTDEQKAIAAERLRNLRKAAA